MTDILILLFPASTQILKWSTEKYLNTAFSFVADQLVKVIFNKSLIFGFEPSHQISNLILNKLFVWHLIWRLLKTCKQKHFSGYQTRTEIAAEQWPLRKPSLGGITVRVWASEGLAIYRQSSSIEQLFHNCYRIEAKQQSETRSKSSMNLMPRISIAKQLSKNPKQYCHSLLPLLLALPLLVFFSIVLTSAQKKIFCIFHYRAL